MTTPDNATNVTPATFVRNYNLGARLYEVVASNDSYELKLAKWIGVFNEVSKNPSDETQEFKQVKPKKKTSSSFKKKHSNVVSEARQKILDNVINYMQKNGGWAYPSEAYKTSNAGNEFRTKTQFYYFIREQLYKREMLRIEGHSRNAIWYLKPLDKSSKEKSKASKPSTKKTLEVIA